MTNSSATSILSGGHSHCSGETKDGMKKISKRREMRLDTNNTYSARGSGISPGSKCVTGGMIGSKSNTTDGDFTSVDEHVDQDHRISCRNLLCNSLGNLTNRKAQH
jgi:hypothetical protein